MTLYIRAINYCHYDEVVSLLKVRERTSTRECRFRSLVHREVWCWSWSDPWALKYPHASGEGWSADRWWLNCGPL